jgi:hypothetical protein
MIEALAKRLCSTFDAFRISSFAAPTQANLAPEVSVRFFTRTVITQTVKSSFFLNSLRTLHLSVPLPKIRPHPKIAHLTKGAAYTLAACPHHRPPTSAAARPPPPPPAPNMSQGLPTVPPPPLAAVRGRPRKKKGGHGWGRPKKPKQAAAAPQPVSYPLGRPLASYQPLPPQQPRPAAGDKCLINIIWTDWPGVDIWQEGVCMGAMDAPTAASGATTAAAWRWSTYMYGPWKLESNFSGCAFRRWTVRREIPAERIREHITIIASMLSFPRMEMSLL